jgi:WD40 repeat protein
MLATASNDNTVKIWDVDSGECLGTLGGHKGRVKSVTFSPGLSNKLVSSSSDKTVKIWGVDSGVHLQTFNIGRTTNHLTFGSGGSCIYTAAGILSIDSSQASNTADTEQPESIECLGLGISSDNMWITHNGKNMIYIPREYRRYQQKSVSVEQDGKTIGVGAGDSGQVWWCTIHLAED